MAALTDAAKAAAARAKAAAVRRRLVFTIAAVGSAGAGASAAIATGSSTLPFADWLERIRDAAANRSYQGTATFTTGGAVTSSRLAHFCSGRERFERVEGLDGRLRRQFRHNERLVTLWPSTRVAVVERYVGIPDFPALPPDALRAEGQYRMRRLGIERVCGFEADVLRLEPLDSFRFGQSLWAERRTGLLLRANTFGPHEDVLETSAFTELSLSPRPDIDSVRRTMRQLGGWRVVRPKVVKTRLEDEGWALARRAPGFELLACHRRPLDASASVVEGATPVQVVHAVFSDGLAQVSLFIEPFDALRHRPSQGVTGATHTSMSRRDEHWLTVVGEVPLSTVQWFESALERRR